MAHPVTDPAELLQTEFHALPLVEVLQKPPRALLGVSDAAAAALQTISVQTIFDLALSRVFDAAARLADAGENPSNPLNRFGVPVGDMLRAPLPPGTRIPEVRFMAPEILAGIPDAAAFSTALGVKTVRDLAFYPPFRAAREILSRAFVPEPDGFDPETPADLVPKSGEYPTERAQYRVLLLDEIRRADNAAPLIDVAGGNFKPVDLSPVAGADFGFQTIGTGALLTFNQSWFMQGVTLGHLLHSMALAPGESTRIAVVDWSRKSRAGQTEAVSETEDLRNDTSHNRSISEVTNAVATEAQSGFSRTEAESYTEQKGISAGLGIVGTIGSGIAGAIGIGGSASDATTSGSAESYSTTAGRREVAASLLQNITDRTHQHAHAARSRRASVVREVSQSEHEQMSTRVITNYNHMHAMTVQYYEVIQLYRTEVSVVGADRVVFIPFKLVDFTKDELLVRFRRALIGAALTRQIADALVNSDTLELAPDRNVRFHVLGGTIKEVASNPGLLNPLIKVRPGAGGTITGEVGPAVEGGGESGRGTPQLSTISTPIAGVSSNAIKTRIASGLWSDQLLVIASKLGGGVTRRGSESLFVPSDVKLLDAEVRSAAGQALTPVFFRRDGTELPDPQGRAVPLSEIARVTIRGSSATANIEASVALTLVRNGVVFPLELPAVTILKAATETRVIQINAAGADVNLKQHLMDHRLHYSQAVFRALDSAMIAGLLSGFSMELNGETVSVAQVVDPIPVRVVGNFLAFKITSDPVADDEWKGFLKRRGIALGQAKVEFIPLSSGGVFAEAVLGRSNCAEKLDLTRFWNWQDSPIPIQPSDIAPLQAGSRAQPEGIAPGPLSTPIVNITAPTALPDPTGMAGVLAAIQNGNMFRDMSGLSEVVKLAQTAIQASSAGATAAGAQASTNMQAAVKAAADVFSAKFGKSGETKSVADKNPSVQGATVNEHDKRKGEAGAGPAGSGSAPETASASGGGKPAPGSGGSSSGNPALDVATFGPDGKPTDEVIRRGLGLDSDTSSPETQVTDEGVPLQDLRVVGNYPRDFVPQIGAEPEMFDAEGERELLATNQWRPNDDDLSQGIGRPRKFLVSFGDLLFTLALLPAGSVRTLSLAGFAHSTLSFSFDVTQTFHKLTGMWEHDGMATTEPPFKSIRMSDLLTAGEEIALPAPARPVRLAEVRKAFAENAEIRIFNMGNPLMENFIQVIANFFQVKTTGFSGKPMQVLAEEIGVSDENPPQLLKSYRYGLGYAIGDPPPAKTYLRMEELLNDPRASTAFPRRP